MSEPLTRDMLVGKHEAPLVPRQCVRCTGAGRWAGADCNLCGGSGSIMWDAEPEFQGSDQ